MTGYTYYLIATGYGKDTQSLTHALHGIEQLVPDNRWGNITVNDIVNTYVEHDIGLFCHADLLLSRFNSSVQAYQMNGNQNGYTMPDFQTLSEQAFIADPDDQSTPWQPGMWPLPICGSDEMAGSLMSIDPAQNDCSSQWPCCGQFWSEMHPGAHGNPAR